MRACDLVKFGEKLADITFPDPKEHDLSRVVSSLVWLLDERKQALAKEADDKEEAEERGFIERACAEEVARIVSAPPAYLGPWILSAAQREAVRSACRKEFEAADEQTRKVVATIDEFAVFCELLSRPENLIKVRTGQYVERQVQTRQETDMVNEMARLFTSLPRYTAYAKVVEERGGEPGIWKGKIRTAKLADVQKDAAEETRLTVLTHMPDYCRPRGHIQEEIHRRQEKWRRPRVRAEAPSGGMEEKKPPPERERAVPVPDEPPPPTRAASSKKPAGTEETKEPANVTKMQLLYSSNFTQPTGWDEEHSEHVSAVRYDGFYHIAVFRPVQFKQYCAYFYPAIVVEGNFLAKVDVCLEAGSGKKSVCGLAFGIHGPKEDEKWRGFLITPTGSFCLCSRTWNTGAGWEESEYIQRGETTNTLLLVREGDSLTLAVNGYCVQRLTDSRRMNGKIGLFVGSSAPDLYAEARFRNLELYTLL